MPSAAGSVVTYLATAFRSPVIWSGGSLPITPRTPSGPPSASLPPPFGPMPESKSGAIAM